MNKRRRMVKQLISWLLVITLVCTCAPISVNAAKKVKLNKKSVKLKIGKTVKLKLKNNKKKVKWSSANKKIATVNKSGLVKAKKKGKTRIVAKVKKKKYICKVTVIASNTNTSQSGNNTGGSSAGSGNGSVGEPALGSTEEPLIETPKPSATAKPTTAPGETPEPWTTVAPTTAPGETPDPWTTAKPTMAPGETPGPWATAEPTMAPGETSDPWATAAPTMAPGETSDPWATAEPTIVPGETLGPWATVVPTMSPGETLGPWTTAVPTMSPGETLGPWTTAAPTKTPSPTVAPTPTRAPSPTVAPTPTRTPTPTVKPTATPTMAPTPTVKPTATPTIAPTVKPTATPTIAPTPTVKPTATPTIAPTPTVKPTATPTIAPTPTATPGTDLPSGATVFTMGTKKLAIGMTEAAVKAVLGSGYRTGKSPQGFDTIAYHTSNYSEYLLIYLKDGKVVGICGIGRNMSFGDAAAGQKKTELGWSGSVSGHNAVKKSFSSSEMAYAYYDAQGDNSIYCIQVFDPTNLKDANNDMIYMTNLSYDGTITASIATETGHMLNAFRVYCNMDPYTIFDRLTKCAQAYCDSITADKIDTRNKGDLLDILSEDYGVEPMDWGEACYYDAADAISFATSLIEQEGTNTFYSALKSTTYYYIGVGMAATGSHTYMAVDYVDEY